MAKVSSVEPTINIAIVEAWRWLVSRPPHRNDYLLLGVTPSATPAELLRAYRRRARDVHHDIHPDDPAAARRFTELAAAYEALAEAARAAASASGSPPSQSVPVVVRPREPPPEPPIRVSPVVVRPLRDRERDR